MFRFYGKRKTECPENPEATESGKKSPWSKFDDLPLEEKRKIYRCGADYVTLKNIPAWSDYQRENDYAIYKKKGKSSEKPIFDVNETLNGKVSLWQGDITTLEIDAIVNAANNSLLGGGGVDGCIHRAAGSTLREECASLDGCSTGDAKITSGHKLPAKYVIHTVGPIGKQEKALKSCYKKCLHLVKKYGLRSVAFCCVSTGIYGYPIYDASSVALNTVRRWLEHEDEKGNKYADLVDRIIFCVFLGGDLDVYQQLLPKYFPSADKFESGQQQEGDKQEKEHESVKDKKEERHKAGESEDVEMDEALVKAILSTDEEIHEAILKEGVPEPPKLEELLDSQEEDMNGDIEQQVNKNVALEEQDSNTEEKEQQGNKKAEEQDSSIEVKLQGNKNVPPEEQDSKTEETLRGNKNIAREQDANTDSKQHLNKDVPAEEQDSNTEENQGHTGMEQGNINPCGDCQI